MDKLVINEVYHNSVITSLFKKVYKDCVFEGCEFIDPQDKCFITDCKFINCQFIHCDFKVSAVYTVFKGSKFINCSFGSSKSNGRSDYSAFYKCNFDNTHFLVAKNIKFKVSSLNGAKIDFIDNAVFVKCSDKYLTISDSGKNVIKITMKDVTRKVVSCASKKASKKGTVKKVSSGKVEESASKSVSSKQ